jgi:hypothetical protein
VKVIVYVEGPSDVAVMKVLLARLIEQCAGNGTEIEFYRAPKGDAKRSLLTKVPKKAVDILRGVPESQVIIVPDLHPYNKAFPHKTWEELRDGVFENFRKALKEKDLTDDTRLEERFHVFCFKHDLEALLLAHPDGIRTRLGVDELREDWVLPVEDQINGANPINPPKRVVERIFSEHRQKYKDTVDAPMILADADYHELAEKCPQCFKPFVEYLSTICG